MCSGGLLAHPLIFNHEVGVEMKEWLAHSLELKRNIIISSEDFAVLNKIQFRELKNYLSGFDVKIIAVYRELVQRLTAGFTFRSNYPEFSEYGIDSFYTFLFTQLNKNGSDASMNFELLMDKLITVFNDHSDSRSIYIIDYYGSLQTHKDVAYIILCEIGHLYCEKASLWNIYKKTSNVGNHNNIYRQIFELVHNSVATQGCTWKVPHVRKAYVKLSRLIDDYRSRFDQTGKSSFYPLPTITTSFAELMPHGKELDSYLGNKYSKFFLYRNQSANMEKYSELFLEELDVKQFFRNPEFINLFNELVEQMYYTNYLTKVVGNFPAVCQKSK